MLYLSKANAKEFDSMWRQIRKHGADRTKLARRVIEIDPMFGPAYMILGVLEGSAGRTSEAERLLWKALECSPASHEAYVALADFHDQLGNDAMNRRLSHLATWIIGYGTEVPEDFATHFASLVPNGMDSTDPETYELLAMAEEDRLRTGPPSPDVEERLRPYVLLNALLREAPSLLADETLKGILEHRDECLPVLRGALYNWVRKSGVVSHPAAYIIIALLGEIGDSTILRELVEMTGAPDEFAHVHWAIHRIAMRLPQEALEAFRASTPAASTAMRCALAEHLYMMDPTPGLKDALAVLLDDFAALGHELDAAHLLTTVAEGLKKLGESDLARTLEARWENALTQDGRRERREILAGADGFVPTLMAQGIDSPDIEDVCIERVLMDDDETIEEDENWDEEDWDDEDEPPPAPKLGRNDPCWCGSGKKYKKCHLASDERRDEPEGPDSEAALLQDPPAHILRDIVERSLIYNQKENEQAMRMYFDIERRAELDESEVGRFTQWVIFDFRNPRTGKTAVERYAQEQGPRRNARERDFLESLRPARLGLYEVQSVEAGRGIQLRNLYTDESTFVHDRSSSRQLMRWDCLFARLHQFEGRTMFVGDGSMLQRDLLPHLQERIARESRVAGQNEADFVASHSHLAHRWIQDLLDDRVKNLQVRTAEGDEMEFSHGHYHVLDQPTLLAALRAREDIVEEAEPDGGGEYRFGWLEGPPQPKGVRSLGHIVVAGERLRLETTSRPRLKKGRRMLEKIARPAVKHLGDSFETVQQAKQRAKTAPESAAKPAKVPPEVEREAIREVKAEYYAKWVDERLPALGGKTPREALATESGRTAVIGLLRTIENLEAREARQGHAAFDVSIVRRDLGLGDD
jgi:hypothetical protein